MKQPNFTFQDIKYSANEAMFQRAKELFESGKIQNLEENSYGYSAKVQGSSIYQVELSYKNIDQGYCDCYMGEQDILCKHLLAVGLAVLNISGKVNETGNISPKNLPEVKLLVSKAFKKIKPYEGPSKIWFSYQRSLEVSAGEILEATQNLLANKENADYLWKLVMKLSYKIAYTGIDDSNGTIGNCIFEIVQQLGKFAKQKPELKPILQKFTQMDTGFGFEEELAELIKI